MFPRGEKRRATSAPRHDITNIARVEGAVQQARRSKFFSHNNLTDIENSVRYMTSRTEFSIWIMSKTLSLSTLENI